MTSVTMRELHARTGHIVRQAAAQGKVVVTERGVPVAELHPYVAVSAAELWKRRRILPEYARIMNVPMGGDSTAAISADRDAR
jgi:prevent-host-death family protein